MIADLFVLALLALEVIALSRLDRRRFGTWATPFTLLGCPFAAVAVLAYVLAPVFDFVPLYRGAIVIWIVGLLVVWAAGNFLGWGLLGLRLAPRQDSVAQTFSEPSPSHDSAAVRLALILAWVSMPVMLYGAMITIRSVGGWTEIGGFDFRDAYSHGLHAHAVVLATLLTIALIGLYRRGNRFVVVTVAMLLIFLMLGQVKGTVLQAIIGGILFRWLRGQFQFRVKKMAFFLLCTYAIFNVAYLLSRFLDSDGLLNGELYSYLGRHYFYYLFAGVLALSEALRSGVSDVGGGWLTIFAPFINMYHASFGGSLLSAGSTHEKGMDTDLLTNSLGGVNVYTLFGTLNLYLGAWGAVLYAIGVGVVCYGALIALRRLNNLWLTAAYCFIASQLVLGFFELYFWYLTSYEIIALGIILGVLTKRPAPLHT